MTKFGDQRAPATLQEILEESPLPVAVRNALQSPADETTRLLANREVVIDIPGQYCTSVQKGANFFYSLLAAAPGTAATANFAFVLAQIFHRTPSPAVGLSSALAIGVNTQLINTAFFYEALNKLTFQNGEYIRSQTHCLLKALNYFMAALQFMPAYAVAYEAIKNFTLFTQLVGQTAISIVAPILAIINGIANTALSLTQGIDIINKIKELISFLSISQSNLAADGVPVWLSHLIIAAAMLIIISLIVISYPGLGYPMVGYLTPILIQYVKLNEVGAWWASLILSACLFVWGEGFIQANALIASEDDKTLIKNLPFAKLFSEEWSKHFASNTITTITILVYMFGFISLNLYVLGETAMSTGAVVGLSIAGSIGPSIAAFPTFEKVFGKHLRQSVAKLDALVCRTIRRNHADLLKSGSMV